MNTVNGNGPAFPYQLANRGDATLVDAFGVEIPPASMVVYTGLSLRDYFAAKAMGAEQWGMPHMHDHITVYDRVAEHAYKMADAMLKARSA